MTQPNKRLKPTPEKAANMLDQQQITQQEKETKKQKMTKKPEQLQTKRVDGNAVASKKLDVNKSSNTSIRTKPQHPNQQIYQPTTQSHRDQNMHEYSTWHAGSRVYNPSVPVPQMHWNQGYSAPSILGGTYGYDYPPVQHHLQHHHSGHHESYYDPPCYTASDYEKYQQTYNNYHHIMPPHDPNKRSSRSVLESANQQKQHHSFASVAVGGGKQALPKDPPQSFVASVNPQNPLLDPLFSPEAALKELQQLQKSLDEVSKIGMNKQALSSLPTSTSYGQGDSSKDQLSSVRGDIQKLQNAIDVIAEEKSKILKSLNGSPE